MKYLVISDIHGSNYYARYIRVIEKREKPDKIVLLGDLYYHGPRNSLTEEYNPMEVANILNEYKDKIIAIRGNCDSAVDQTISEFEMKLSEEIVINDLEFFFTHGDIYNKSNPPRFSDVVVLGHSHIGEIGEFEGKIYLNPGSLSLPRGDSKHSYATINEEEIILKEISGEIIEKRSIKK